MDAHAFRFFGAAGPGLLALVGFLLLHERMSALQVTAVLLIITASVGTVMTHAAAKAGPAVQGAEA